MINKRILKKLKLVAIPLSVLASISLIFLNFVFPKIDQVLKLKKEITVQKERIKILSAKVNDLKTLSEAELFSTSELLLTALPANKDFYLGLSSIQKIFTEEGFVIKSYQFNPGLIATDSSTISSSTNDKEFFPIKLFFKGDKEKLPQAIDKIEKALPILSIDYLKIESQSSASDSGLFNSIEGSINVNGFYSPLPKNLGKIDSPLPKMTEQKKAFAETLRSYTRYSNESAQPMENIFVGKENPFPF